MKMQDRRNTTCGWVIWFVLLGLAPGIAAHEGIHEQIAAVTLQIQAEPRNAQLYLMRGELHRLHRDWVAARSDFERVAQLDAAMREVEFSRGRLWLDAAQPRLSVAAFTRFLVHQPTHAESFILRARAYVQLKQYRAAANDYTRAIALLPRAKPDHYLERAAALAHAGQRAAALRSLDAGIVQLGSLVTLQLKAIELETQLKLWDAALVRVDLLAAQTPRKETWLVKRAEILRQANRHTAARTAYEQAAQALAALPPAQRNIKAMDDLAAQIQAALSR
jgi:tetratricopeptide (TPR) repeat protein